MQKVNIPVRLDPVRSAQKRLRYDGVIPQQVLPRLVEMAVPEGRVEVTLACDRDEQNLAVMRTQVRTQLQLVCQRCNDTFLQDVDIDVSYSPVRDDDAAEQLPSIYEPVMLTEDEDVHIHQLIEDEVLLAVPFAPMHEPGSCKQTSHMSWGELDESVEDKPNPFAVLNKLKNSEE
ncbi:YceD family protein [Neiella marina]|uniref:Large ribosomal RNA subunit accumulation protein YceD n=1 Tax=Neiella holothuriorum TaxID=2870530 RepID=A0ABS7EJV8_9GAMM|nr:YceD family protein [Neiella holothuriorum]MBW8192616.1 YceD family protein [Neiella holothuriorum]